MIAKMIKFVLRFLLTTFNSIIAAVIIIGLGLFYAHQVEPNWIQVREQPIYVKNLPQNFRSLRIIQISDLHGKNFQNDDLVERINLLKPDIVVITGDIFDNEQDSTLNYATKVLGGLRAEYGVFYVLGNNDYYLGSDQVIKELKSIGIRTLRNNSCQISVQGQHISLIGLEDPYLHKANLGKALEGVEKSSTRILLAHTPAIFNEAAEQDIDLLLVGHTHGGQIIVPNLPDGISYLTKNAKYVAGLYQEEQTQMYVNRGLGETKLPLRFLVRPEITVITLHRQE